MKKKMRVFMSLAIILSIGILVACGNSGRETELTELRIGLLLDDSNPQREIAFENFRSALERHLGMPVTIIEDATHIVGIEAMRANPAQLDVMWASSWVYLLAQRTVQVEQLVVLDIPGETVEIVFITSSERDDIRSIEDVRTLAFNNATSTAFNMGMYYLIESFSWSRDEILAGGTLFDAVTFTGHQNANIVGVINGDFDASVVNLLPLRTAINTGLIQEDDVKIIARTYSPALAGFIARSDLPEDIVVSLRDFLLNFDDVEYFTERFGNAQARYVQPNEENINRLLAIVEALGLDLEEQAQ